MNKQMAILAMSLSMAAFASPRDDDRECDHADRRGPYLESRAHGEHFETERFRVERDHFRRVEIRHGDWRECERREPVRVVEVVREAPPVVLFPRARLVISWP
jgi:hypothetical protein